MTAVVAGQPESRWHTCQGHGMLLAASRPQPMLRVAREGMANSHKPHGQLVLHSVYVGAAFHQCFWPIGHERRESSSQLVQINDRVFLLFSDAHQSTAADASG